MTAWTAIPTYDLAGHEMTEVSATGGWNRGEVYAGGRHIATYNNGTTYFNHADWLGTERVRTSMASPVCETIVNTPFGDGQAASGSCSDSSPMHFTGKQRDTETNLDDFGARYFTSAMGRWVTPDWSARPSAEQYADLSNPQSLNLYAYVNNNPTTHVDADGHAVEPANDFAQGTEMQGSSEGSEFEDFSGEIGDIDKTPDQLIAETRFLQALAQAIGPDYTPPGGVETLGVTAGRINNETLTDKDSKNENVPLSEAEKQMAHQRFNAERAYGNRVQGKGGSHMMDPLMRGPGYARALAATIAAAREDGMGVDPTLGATHYNMRTPAQAIGQHTFYGFQVHTISGPYISSTPFKYIVTYGPPIYADPVLANRGIS